MKRSTPLFWLIAAVCVVGLWVLKPRSTTNSASSGGAPQPAEVTGPLNPQQVAGRTALPAFSPRAKEVAPQATSTYGGPMTLYRAVEDWPPEMGEGQSFIKSFALAVALHDAVFVNPEGSDEDIVQNAESLGVPEDFVRENLRSMYEAQDFSQHLSWALLNPELQQVHDVLVAQQVQVDFQSDLLIDAFRVSSFHTSLVDSMDELEKILVEGARGELSEAHLEEIQRRKTVKAKSLETVNDFYRQRFEARHRLSPEIASRVVEALSNVEVRTAPPPAFAVPRIRRP